MINATSDTLSSGGFAHGGGDQSIASVDSIASVPGRHPPPVPVAVRGSPRIVDAKQMSAANRLLTTFAVLAEAERDFDELNAELAAVAWR